MDLVEKYRPRTLSEVRGNRKALEELRKWALNWPSDKSAALLYGRPGTGKTSAAIALANDMGWQLLELNASDKRTQGIITETAGEASKNATLLDAKKLILLDEIDNLHGTSDRGGAKAVTEIVKKTREPIILTANDAHGVSSTLRRYCTQIHFFEIREESAQKALIDIWDNEKREALRAKEAIADLMDRLEEPNQVQNNEPDLAAVASDLKRLARLSFDFNLLQKISEVSAAVAHLKSCLEEAQRDQCEALELSSVSAELITVKNFFFDLGILQEAVSDVSHSLDTVNLPSIELIVKNSKGDLRSAINDFQAFIGGTVGETAARDRAESSFNLMRSVFNDKDAKKPLIISYAVDETPEDLIHWIDENLPRALKRKVLARAFQVLSKADIYLGRTRKRQNYGLWRYANELMTSGVNVVARTNHEQSDATERYSPPTRWMRLGQTRSKRRLRDSVASKIASTDHISVTRAREEILLLYKELALRDPARVTAAFHLNAEELSFLMDVKKDAAVVKQGLQDAEILISERGSTRELISRDIVKNLDARARPSENRNDSAPKPQKQPDRQQIASDSKEKRKSGPRRGQKYLDEF
ncbi:MAG: replication factor C large subunit [Halobacteriota archaeon]